MNRINSLKHSISNNKDLNELCDGVYLFGSFLTNNEFNDIDIAIKIKDVKNKRDSEKIIRRILKQITNMYDSHLDIIWLDRTFPDWIHLELYKNSIELIGSKSYLKKCSEQYVENIDFIKENRFNLKKMREFFSSIN